MTTHATGAQNTPYTAYVMARTAAEMALRQIDAIGAAMNWLVPREPEPEPEREYKKPPPLAREPEPPSVVDTVAAAMEAADRAERVQQATVYAEPVSEELAELLVKNGVKTEGLVYNADGTLRKKPGRKPRKAANDLPAA